MNLTKENEDEEDRQQTNKYRKSSQDLNEDDTSTQANKEEGGFMGPMPTYRATKKCWEWEKLSLPEMRP